MSVILFFRYPLLSAPSTDISSMSRTYKEMLSTAEFLEHVGQGRHLPPIPTFDGFLAEEEMAEEGR
jgi:hypothetical protein